MARIIPLRTGWEAGVADATFYPQDLPEEWRLSYFSCLYHGVLVPEERWRRAEVDELGAWVADTPARFRFYLDLDGAISPRDIGRLKQALGARLGGLVHRGVLDTSMLGPGAPDLFRLDSSVAHGDAPARQVPPERIGDLRSARDWIRTFVQREDRSQDDLPTLLLLGDCRFDHLDQWQSLLELMGVA